MSDVITLSDHLLVLPGAVHTGVLRVGAKAVLFDCCDTVTPARLAALGITRVERICVTGPRRAHMAGAEAFPDAALTVAGEAAALCSDPMAYWNDWPRRWVGTSPQFGWTFQPVNEVPVTPLPVAQTVADGDEIVWEGFRIRVLALEPLLGSRAYLVEADGRRVLFSGDYLHGAGQFWELYPFQVTYGDSHGIGTRALDASLTRLAETDADTLVPAHGAPFGDVRGAVAATLQALTAVRETYKPAPTSPEQIVDPPPFVVRIPKSTGFAIVADDGTALLADLGDDCAVWELAAMRQQGVFKDIDAVYVSHFHGDHHWAMNHLYFYHPGVQVLADARQAEILQHPHRFASRCLTSRPIPVHRALADGESWAWKEFTLTSYHAPSHTYYAGALLVEGHGMRLLFCGDACGHGLYMGDYCAYNRLMVGDGVGCMRMLDVVEATQPDLLFSGHSDRPARWTAEQLAFQRGQYRRRAEHFAALIARPHPNFALDPEWATAYPYEQEAPAGARIRVDVVCTNYGPAAATMESALLLPVGWTGDTAPPVTIPAGAEGRAVHWCTLPADAAPGLHVLPIRLTWDGQYLGQFRQALVRVW